MSQYLEVYLKDTPLGVVSWNQTRQEGRFECYDSFLETETDLSPISFPKAMLKRKIPIPPFSVADGQLKNIPPFLTDCLPGEYAMTLLRYALKGTGKTPERLSPLALFSLLGNRGVGAYRFEPHGYPELDLSEPLDIGRLVRYARNICQEKGKGLTENRLRELLRSGLFTIGSWPESLVAVNDFTGEVRSGQSDIPVGFEGWTLKLDGVKSTDETTLTNEYNYYLKAVRCGLDMAPCRQIKEGNHTHLLIKRVDRVKQEKIHVQSFAALRDEPSDSCEAVFRCMRLLQLTYPELMNYYKRVVFNVLNGNRQETARDILFTCQGNNEWHLAPSSRLYQPSRPYEQTLSLCGKQENQTLEDVLILGKSQGIRKCADLVARIQSFFKAVT